MALIACPECTREISDKATTCPHCGNPMATAQPTNTSPAAPIAAITPDTVVTTQATGKEWKIVQLVGAGIMVVGVISCAGNSANAFNGGMLFFLGCAVFLGGRIGAWWSHG